LSVGLKHDEEVSFNWRGTIDLDHASTVSHSR
jgi:hypothetical protein